MQSATSIVPERGFIRHYFDNYVRGTDPWVTDAPDTYHVACALGIMSAALMDRLAYPWAGRATVPNLCLMLVGDSTHHRKSTAMRLALSVSRADPDTEEYIGLDEMSAEALLEHLQEHPTQLIPLMEMGDFLTVANTWGERLKPVLMTLIDCPEVYKKKIKRSEFVLRDPRVGILASINTALISQVRGTQLDWESGFFARFMCVCPGGENGDVAIDWRRPIITYPSCPPDGIVRWLAGYLINLRHEAARRGAGKPVVIAGMEDGAAKRYEAWQADNTRFFERLNLPAGQNRLELSVVKIATLLTADFSSVAASKISEEAMFYATNFGTVCAKSLACVWGDYAPTGEARDITRISEMIKRAGPEGMKHSKTLRNAHMKAKNFGEIIETLIGSGLVKNIAPANSAPIYCSLEIED